MIQTHGSKQYRERDDGRRRTSLEAVAGMLPKSYRRKAMVLMNHGNIDFHEHTLSMLANSPALPHSFYNKEPVLRWLIPTPPWRTASHRASGFALCQTPSDDVIAHVATLRARARRTLSVIPPSSPLSSYTISNPRGVSVRRGTLMLVMRRFLLPTDRRTDRTIRITPTVSLQPSLVE